MPQLIRQPEIDSPTKQFGSVEGFCPEAPSNVVKQNTLPVGPGSKGFDLSPLEKRIIALSVAGYSHEERANILGISGLTLRLHLLDICDKLDVACEFELILFALYYHVIDGPEVGPPCAEPLVPI